MSKTVVQKLQDKVKYYKQQEKRMVRAWLTDNKRTSRDSVIRCGERMTTYNECIELIKLLDK